MLNKPFLNKDWTPKFEFGYLVFPYMASMWPLHFYMLKLEETVSEARLRSDEVKYRTCLVESLAHSGHPRHIL